MRWVFPKKKPYNNVSPENFQPMKNVILLVLLLFAPLFLASQERLNDTVVGDTRYAILLDSHGEVAAYKSAVPFDETQAVIDLNNRLRSIAGYQAVAIPSGIAGAFALSYAGFHKNPNYGISGESRYTCDHPGWAVFGVAASVTSVVMCALSYAELWTPRLYVNQDGLVFRLDGKKKAYYRHELGKEDE